MSDYPHVKSICTPHSLTLLPLHLYYIDNHHLAKKHTTDLQPSKAASSDSLVAYSMASEAMALDLWASDASDASVVVLAVVAASKATSSDSAVDDM